MNNIHILLNRDIELHKRNLSSWTSKVLRCQSLLDAVHMARHIPIAGSLVRSMPGMYRVDQSRARRKVLDHLLKLAAELDDETLENLRPDLLRASAGAWPEVYRAISARGRSSAS